MEDELALLKKNKNPIPSFIRNYTFPHGMKIEGVNFSALCASIKSDKKLDLTLIEIREGASLSGVFTTSQTRSSPVRWCEEIFGRRKNKTLCTRTQRERGF